MIIKIIYLILNHILIVHFHQDLLSGQAVTNQEKVLEMVQ